MNQRIFACFVSRVGVEFQWLWQRRVPAEEEALVAGDDGVGHADAARHDGGGRFVIGIAAIVLGFRLNNDGLKNIDVN
ncbi:hypothetical protein GUJ93_ZPchr0002g23856 [Zizania palustris]|uniref:Uncharacterized protein n=1 Tax=Zizania palustris TaxID=103762 RepID=A0A8J5SPG1_ZIZPA|nr:hypothetical protein GUJ93_ZPchr0002g23856 [Zizania palustris]